MQISQDLDTFMSKYIYCLEVKCTNKLWLACLYCPIFFCSIARSTHIWIFGKHFVWNHISFCYKLGNCQMPLYKVIMLQKAILFLVNFYKTLHKHILTQVPHSKSKYLNISNWTVQPLEFLILYQKPACWVSKALWLIQYYLFIICV